MAVVSSVKPSPLAPKSLTFCIINFGIVECGKLFLFVKNYNRYNTNYNNYT